jgi:hypothetical protein
MFTIDRFDFDKGPTTIRYLDDFFRQSSYTNTVLALGTGAAAVVMTAAKDSMIKTIIKTIKCQPAIIIIEPFDSIKLEIFLEV